MADDKKRLSSDGVLSGTQIASAMVPNVGQDSTFPSHYSYLGHGGLRTVNTINDRNKINWSKRELGMQVFVIEDQSKYRLMKMYKNDQEWTDRYINGENKEDSSNTLTSTQRGEDLDNNCWAEVVSTVGSGGDIIQSPTQPSESEEGWWVQTI